MGTKLINTKNEFNMLVRKPGEREREKPLGRRRRRWEDNIRIDVTETGWEVVDWMHLAEDKDQWRVHVYTVMNLRVS
jgi:hypothetical protein